MVPLSEENTGNNGLLHVRFEVDRKDHRDIVITDQIINTAFRNIKSSQCL